MENRKVVKPITVKGKKFMPYPERKPKDGVKLLIVTKENHIAEAKQIDTGFGREFYDIKLGRTYYPNEIKGWWYLEKEIKPSTNSVEINYNKY